MRLIDADAIEDKAKQYSLGYYEEDEWAVPFKEITSAPTIDLVRCGECIYAREQDGFYECDYSKIVRDPEGYCDIGERKESE